MSTPPDHRLTASTSRNPIADLNSNDPVKVKRALNTVDPAIILKDLETPARPRWAESFEDWVEIHMPRSIFEPWAVQQGDEHTYYEYGRVRQRLGIRCLPTSTHDSTSRVLQAQGSQEIGKLSSQSQGQLIIGQSTQFMGFDFPGLPPNRTKEPDAYLTLRGRESPLVVLEAGWAEREDDLIKDAQLWLHGTYDLVTFVVIVIFTESGHLRIELPENDERKFTGAETEDRLSDGRIIDGVEEDGPGASFADMRTLALKLQELEKDGALMKPLLGEIEARMSIYRKVRQGDPETSIMSSVGFGVDDLRVFLANEAKVFPAADSTAIDLPWAEILIRESEDVALEDFKRTLSLNPMGFQEEIKEALPQMLKKRALDRAALILERKGRMVPGPTFSQLKRSVDDGHEDYATLEAQGSNAKKRKTAP